MKKDLKKSIFMDTRLKRKIEEAYEFNGVYSIKFTDIQDAFWFDDNVLLQEFVRNQEVERYYDKSLRKGVFDYINENNETLRYEVITNRGTLTVVNEVNLGVL